MSNSNADVLKAVRQQLLTSPTYSAADELRVKEIDRQLEEILGPCWQITDPALRELMVGIHTTIDQLEQRDLILSKACEGIPHPEFIPELLEACKNLDIEGMAFVDVDDPRLDIHMLVESLKRNIQVIGEVINKLGVGVT